MTLPVGITTCAVSTGSALDFFGNDVTLSVVVKPVVGGTGKDIVWQATGRPLVVYTTTFTAGAGLPVTFNVPHVDQTGFVDSNDQSVTMWAYQATITATLSGQTQTWVKNFQPLTGQTSIDLDLVPDGSISSQVSAPIPPVLSVNGMTGNVVVGGGGGGGSVTSVAGRTGDVILSKTDVVLSNVDNTSDANKPISSLTQTALNAKAADATVVHTSGAESVSGVKTFNGSPIVPTPTTNQQAANKLYVDSVASTVVDATAFVKGIVQLAGDLGGTAASPTTPTAVHVTGAESVSGVKTFSAQPIVPTPTTTTAVANKAYVDAGDALAVHTTGAETVAGVKTFSSQPIVPTPTTSTAAANKAYVDANTGGGTLATIPAGLTLTVAKAAGVWPARPTSRTDLIVQWKGPDPSPAIVTSGTGGMLQDVDIRLVTP